MSEDKQPRTPSGLQRRGRQFWKQSVNSFDFTASEESILLEACRCMDRLDVLDQSIRATGPMVTGSQGQPVVNPALTEARGQQVVLHRLLAALKLPDEDGDSLPSAHSTAGSLGASMRWGAAHEPWEVR